MPSAQFLSSDYALSKPNGLLDAGGNLHVDNLMCGSTREVTGNMANR
jgi:hypothetical protein